MLKTAQPLHSRKVISIEGKFYYNESFQAWNCDSSLYGSQNKHQSLRGSHNHSRTLSESNNYDEALHRYTYDNDTLKDAGRFGNSCISVRHNSEW